MTTGEKIAKARKDAKLTQKELGIKLGVSAQSVAQWENNLRNPKFETLLKIADALDASVLEFFPDQNRQLTNFVYQSGFEESQAELRDFGYSFSETEIKLVQAFSALNETGQTVACERVEELAEMPKYKRTDAVQSGGGIVSPPDEKKPPEGPETPSDGNK